MNTSLKTIGSLTVFAIAMAALEGAVVVYLRALYYPEEFAVNFKIIDAHILTVEIVRELATLIMLLAVGYMSGKNFTERFAYFLFSFAIWDIFYYGWLKIFIDWPTSLFDWDILFLIPITWIGPVAAPLLCSLTMIVFAFFLLRLKQPISKTVWFCMVLGGMMVLFTFMRDYASLIISNDFLKDYPYLLQNQNFMTYAGALIPKPYQWNIFWAGELMFVIGIIVLRLNKTMSNKLMH